MPAETVSYPFCKEDDFDLVGLKLHFVRGWCEKFNETPIGWQKKQAPEKETSALTNTSGDAGNQAGWDHGGGANAEKSVGETRPAELTKPVRCAEDIGFGMQCRRERGHAGPHAQNPRVLFGEEPV